MKFLLVQIAALFIALAPVVAKGQDSVWLRGKVLDSVSGNPLPARVVVTNEKGETFHSFYTKLPGFFTSTDGSFQLKVVPGRYSISVHHGLDYLSAETSVDISTHTEAQLTFRLARWFDLKANGWVNGDGHDHLYTDIKPDLRMLDTVRQICLAQGIDFMCTAQGWAGYNDSNWRAGYARFSDSNFLLHYGSEMPKYRTGHTWWLGQTSTRGLFEQTMDTTYENRYYQSDQGTSWTFDSLRFPQIPDFEVVQRFKMYDDAIPVIPHPTSWWWQKRGDIEKYVTNVASYIPFGLLAGKIWPMQVVMGYDHDHYYYQNLWFNVLNEGYRITPSSELDGGYNRGDKFYYGSMRTYYKVDGMLTIDKIKDAANRGHVFVTSGPIVMAEVDGRYQVGDIVNADGKRHVLKFQAKASGDKNDYLSYVVLFRNGRIKQVWDLRSKKQRDFDARVDIVERENCWYVLKVYGRQAWGDPALLDVMAYSSKKINGGADSVGTESDVAITSPFYFRKDRYTEPPALVSKLKLRLRGSENRAPTSAKIDVLVNGVSIQSVEVKNGKASFSIPVQAVLKISVAGQPPVYRCLYMDYKPYLDIVEELASGRWLNKMPEKYGPGEVSWQAFRFAEIKKVLSSADWEIDLSPNERDPLWERFNRVFTN